MPRPSRKPSLTLSIVLFAAFTAATAYLRLYVFRDQFVLLTYGLPLLVCVWHRDLRLLWAMAVTFIAMAAGKAFWLVPDVDPNDTLELRQWLMQVVNIVVVGATVHAVVVLLSRLRAQNAELVDANDRMAQQNEELQSQSEELAQQGEELQQQSEELTRQNEELQQQGEELEQQGEELHAQAEELRAANEDLSRREALLGAVLSALRDFSDEREAMQRLCASLLPMLGGAASAVAVVERVGDLLTVRAHVNINELAQESWPLAQSFARTVIERGQTGFIDDLSARPDLLIPQPKRAAFRSILSTPLRVQGACLGAVEAYAEQPQRWTTEHFRVIEWAAGQCSVLLELMRAHRAVSISEQRYSSFVRASAQVVWTTDARGQVVMDIPAWQALTGQSAREAAGFGWMNAIHAEDQPRVAEAWRAASESKGVYEVEYRLRIHDGSWRDILARGVPVIAADGSVREYVGTCIDVTARKRAERQLQELNAALERRVAERTAEARLRADQLQRLAGELTRAEQKERQRLAAILHDSVQQLLVGAKFHLDTLRKRRDAAARREAIDQVDRLLDESLATSRSLTVDLSPPILRDGSFAKVLQWLGRWAAEKHRLSVQVEADEKADPGSDGTRLLLFQAVREMLLNARKHSGVDRAQVAMSRLADGQIEIVVTDGGVGFDAERVQALRADGVGSHTGLGLFGIRERAELLGGRLELHSRPGEGTRIRLLVPQAAGAELSDAGAEGTATGAGTEVRDVPAVAGGRPVRDGRAIRVLLVDDHAVVRDGLTRLLQTEHDIEVVGEAGDGQEAWDMALRLRPDVILMDVSMPRMGGIEATRRVMHDLPQTRIIGLSMHVEEDVAAEMIGAGAARYLTKTSQPPVLLAAIRECTTRESA